MNCPCNPSNTYSDCCEPILKGKQIALTAEQLMRSRYTAFVLADINYLMVSHHPRTRPLKEKKSILQWTKSVQWIKLEVLNTLNGQENDSTGYVEFKAYFMEKGKVECIHENSFFVKEKGKWFYKDGKQS
jgi:SEC-C motif-containing protein